MSGAVKLSILMPVYNEARTVQAVVKRVLDVDFPCPVEVVIVDDASTDATAEILGSFHDERLVKLRHPVNRGKGAAIRTAVAAATGDFMVPLDADLEYQPEEIPKLLEPVLSGEAEVVYGSRSFGSHAAYSFWYVMGNKAVTTFANVLFNAYIADLETCFKLMPLDLLRSLRITSEGFGMEAEITGKLLARRIRPFEVPITYRARSREAGKKITWRDGVEAIWILARIRMTTRRAKGRPEVKELRGDRQVQCDVLVALAECRNHRTWFAEFAQPYLGDHPVEIGSGLGDYAREWIPLVTRFTATDADEAMVVGLKRELAGYPHVDVRQIWLPTTARAEYSCLISYNVLEHIRGRRRGPAQHGRAGPGRRVPRPGLPGVPVRDEPGRHRHRARPPLHQAHHAGGADRSRARGRGPEVRQFPGPDLLLRVHQPAAAATVRGRDDDVLRPDGGPGGPRRGAADQAAALRPVRGRGRPRAPARSSPAPVPSPRFPASAATGAVDRGPVGPVGEAEAGGGQVPRQGRARLGQPHHDPADVQGAQVRPGLRDLRLVRLSPS